MEYRGREKFTQIIGGYVTNTVMVYVAFCIAFLSSKLIRLPLHSADGISNKFLASGYSPEVNFARVAWVIVVGALIFLLIRRIEGTRPRLFRLLTAMFIAGTVFGAFIVPTVDSFGGNVDTFHHGEQLSPGNAFNHGKPLYTGMFVLHGAGEDIFVPALALHLPGTPKDGGIGSYYFVVGLLKTLTAFVFTLFLARYLRSTAIFLVASFWFIFSSYSSFYDVRDLFTWTLLILLWYVFHARFEGRRRIALLSIVGALSSLGIIYSVDRGIIGLFLTVCCLGFLLFTEARGKATLRIRLPRRFADFYAAGYVVIGGLLVQITYLALIGAHSYKEFLVTSFITIPKYDGLLFNSPLPNTDSTSYSLWLPVFLGILGMLMLGYLLRVGYALKRYSPQVLLYTVLLVTGVAFLRTGYGRPDSGHIAYATPLLFATLFMLASNIWEWGMKRDMAALWLPILFAATLFFPVNNVSSSSLSIIPSINLRAVADFRRMPGRPNSYWVPSNVANVADYIKKNTKPTDSIFVFTQQPIYYYLTQRNNPTRFYIPWFADPQPLTNEMLADLKRTPPKIVVFNSGSSWDAPDGFTESEMSPEVADWIKKNYPTTVMIGQVTLRTK